MSDLQFGIFDWLDESGRGIGETYAERLRMLELADRSGFYAYHLAEHHATELSTVPSPHLFLAAAAQRTQRLRLGPLSVILPLYEPIRLLEEVAMLDQLSAGRVDLGISRGSTGEHIENDPEKAREMFDEALDVIRMGLSKGEITYRGKHYQYEGAITRITPVQKPYPPLWYPTSNLESIPWIAKQGMNTAFSVHLSPNFDRVVEMVQRYRHALPTTLGPEPKVGFSLHVHVGETDEQARQRAKPAFERFMHNFTYRFVRRGMPNRYADRANFGSELERGRLVVGSPATVRDQLGDYIARSGVNYVLGVFAFGSLSVEEVLSSMSLFVSEVMPALSRQTVRA